MRKIEKVSIITLTYKNWRLLDKAINSVRSQIVSKDYFIEYLIVDDATEDFDQELVERKLLNFPFTNKVIVNSNNVGTVKSFNNAISMSSGELIIPLSADDMFFDENVVGDIIRYFENNSCSILTAVRVPDYVDYDKEGFPLMADRDLFVDGNVLLKRIALNGNIISGASTYYHRKIFDKLGFFDENYILLEDYPFYLKALMNNLQIDFFDRKTIFFGLNGVSSKGKINPILANDLSKVHDFLFRSMTFSFFEKRYFYFTKILSRKERMELRNLIFYFDQFIISIGVKLYNHF